MKKTTAIVLLLIGTVFAACTKKASPAKAPKEVPVTFVKDIQPLMYARCANCHIPSKGGKKGDFETYESAKRYAAEILDRVMIAKGQRGFMPKNGEKLPDTEIALIKKWIDQGLLEK